MLPSKSTIIKNVATWMPLLVSVCFWGVMPTVWADDTNSSAVSQFQAWLNNQDQSDKTELATATTTQANTQTVNTSALEGTFAKGTESELAKQAFDSMVDNSMPMTPDQIVKYREKVSQTQLAASTYPDGPPKPVSSTLSVSLAPGAAPVAIKLAQGFITSVVFVDSTGAPWPITAYDLGNSQAFSIQWDKKSNILMIQPQKPYPLANMAVMLKGLNTPVMISLVAGQREVAYRMDLRVNGLGPNAKQASSSDMMATGADSELMEVLDGVPPEGATQLTVANHVAQVWAVNGIMYVRTHYTILSPGWLSTMKSPDGTKAYKMQLSPSLLISQNGKPVQIRVEGE